MAEDNESPRVILMGATGSGMSTFISNIIGRDIGIGHKLESQTSTIQEFKVHYGGKTVFLVDTPGFDHAIVPDITILKKINGWVKKKCLKREALAGVIYLHMICSPRTLVSAKRNLEKFKGLCGKNYSPRMAFASTHWAEEGTRQYGQDAVYLEQFKKKWSKSLIQNGVTTFELKSVAFHESVIAPSTFHNPIVTTNVKGILDHVLDLDGKAESNLLLQPGVVDQMKKTGTTTARSVNEDLVDERLGQINKRKLGALLQTEVADDQRPRVILLGATGSGKSTFISSIAGKDIGIGYDLESKTNQTEEFEVQCGDKKVLLVDTPGLNHTYMSNDQVLQSISDWLKKKSLKGEALAGIIYLQRVSDSRSKRNIQIIQDLCGKDYSPRIALVSTHWAEKGTRQYKEDVARQGGFEQSWWKSLIGTGAKSFKLETTPVGSPSPIDSGDAESILGHILNV